MKTEVFFFSTLIDDDDPILIKRQRLHDLISQFFLFPILVGVFLSVTRAGGT